MWVEFVLEFFSTLLVHYVSVAKQCLASILGFIQASHVKFLNLVGMSDSQEGTGL